MCGHTQEVILEENNVNLILHKNKFIFTKFKLSKQTTKEVTNDSY